MLTKIILWLRFIYVALSAYNRVSYSKHGQWIFSGLQNISNQSLKKAIKSSCQNLNPLHCRVSCSKIFFFRKEDMHWFAFWCHPLAHSHCLVYLKDFYSFFNQLSTLLPLGSLCNRGLSPLPRLPLKSSLSYKHKNVSILSKVLELY